MSTRPFNAFFLAEDEQALALDRKVLRRLGVTQALFFASGGKALLHLKDTLAVSAAANGDIRPAAAPLEMIICSERLADMNGLQFLAHIRSLAGYRDIPAVLLVSNAQSPLAVAARATNSCAVLARPYSPDQAEEMLYAATLPESRRTPMALPPSFAARPETARAARKDNAPLLRRDVKPAIPDTPGEKALHEGLKALRRGDTLAADRLLHGSYEADPGRIETCLALSRLYAVKENAREELAWLCRAGALCLKRGETARARGVFDRLPRGKDGQGPLLAEAGLILQAGEVKAAALTFLEAHRLDPAQPLHTLIGRTCMFTPAPEEHMLGLIKALAANGHGATATSLHRRLFQPPREAEEETHSFLARFPMLHDIVCVASHTFKAWRHAA